MLKLTATKHVGRDINVAVVMILNGKHIGMVAPPREHAAELVGVLNGAAEALEALRILPPEKLMLLANWFELEQEERPGWTRGKAVQEDLRRMAQLSLNALAKAKGGAE